VATALHVRDVQLSDFQKSVIDESFKRPVAVDFWATWCGPCRVLSPVLERLADEFGGDFLLAKVNTEENPELAEHFAIRSIPNVKLFKNGTVVDEFMGAVSESKARSFLRKHCPTAADRKYSQGLALLERRLPDEAQREFESALELDSSHGGALVELGKMRATAGDTAGAESFWNRVSISSPASGQAQQLKQSLEFQVVCTRNGGPEAAAALAAAEPANLEARYAHACCLVVAGDFRGALEEFLSVLSRDKNFQDQTARKAMLTVFALVGERSDLAEEYRKRLAQVLF
jgi:putative thioredoxin